jgi:integrase
MRGLSMRVLVGFQGTKSLYYSVYEGGKIARWQRLGAFPAMTAAQALQAATSAHKAADKPTGSNATLLDVYTRWLARKKAAKHLRAAEVERILDRYVKPSPYAAMPFESVRRRDYSEMIAKLHEGAPWNNNKPVPAEMCDSILTKLQAAANWYQDTQSEDYVNPIHRKMRLDPTPTLQKARQRWLKDSEIQRLWQTTSDDSVFSSFVRLLLLTGQRREMLVSMQWSHVNLTTGEWTLHHDSKREKPTAEKLVLPKFALDILKIEKLRGYSKQHVFATKSGKRFARFGACKAALDKALGAGFKAWTLHGLRHTISTAGRNVGIAGDVIEAILGHVQAGTAVSRIYNHSKVPQSAVTEGLAKWAGHVEALASRPFVSDESDLANAA